MGSKMLIDAAHPEETRVVVVRGSRVEEFDYESASRKQLRGNIYLAKVTRVEPSLQAAFVDYGGNRHGFLAFSEIHPDYYQIPVADRQVLLAEEAEEASKAAAEDEADGGGRTNGSGEAPDDGATEPELGEDAEHQDGAEALPDAPEPHGLVEDQGLYEVQGRDAGQNGNGDSVESVGSEDALEEVPVRVQRRRRIYKIQEVIKRRQIILVQVVKEERGNKGAALTTYLSLAGRYTVLMPNTARGGGISRKITNATDRKRLRKIAGELNIADGMGLIIRTAGAARTKTEVKRDCEYLLRMWENIRDLTLKSTAPALVYEEGSLIKRSIRDLYTKEIDEIQVAGDDAYKEAKGFMRMLMPSHAKNVRPYKEPEPIFVRNQVERQLSAMFSPHVTLKSGGYVVLNQTEALVSIDVNSGKSTREHNIEDTALKTNMEAAAEIARQLRLRDLAGLIVIDFIDMEERRNNRSVERKIKECLKTDRARIQVGRISHFGLLEMSRQRLRAGMLEGSTNVCPMCQGTGIVRSTESIALDVLRSLEDTLLTAGVSNLRALTSVDAALYILNHKRAIVRDIEERYAITVLIEADPAMQGASFVIQKAAATEQEDDSGKVIRIDSVLQAADDPEAKSDDEQDGRRSRRRRRGRRGRGRDKEAVADTDAEAKTPDAGDADEANEASAANGDEAPARKPRRRGRRGGRRTRASAAADAAPASEDATAAAEANGGGDAAATADEADAGASAEDEPPPKPKRRAAATRRRGRTAAAKADGDDADAKTVDAEPEPAPEPESEPVAAEMQQDLEDDAPRRSGWWQRRA